MKSAAYRLPLLFWLLSASASAASPDPWLRIQSSNFELFTTGGERAGRQLVQHFEQVRAFFLQAFGVKSTDGKPVRIIAFRSEKEFQPYRPNDVATAFYHPGSEYDYIVMSGSDPDHYEVATHEYTHLLIGQTTGTVPLWLNEGMAELYSTAEQVGTQVLVGIPPAGRIPSLLEEGWIDLDALLATNGGSPLYNQRSRAGIFYAESWALVHMLNLSEPYRQHLLTMLQALKTGSSQAAFQQAYGKSPLQVQADLQAYVSGRDLHGVAFQLALTKAAETPEIQARSAMMARLALAELLSDYPGKLAQAGDAYVQVARDFPQNWEPQAAWGRFAGRERRDQEATGHFARAVAQGANDPGMFVAYGRALSGTNHADGAIDALRQALRLDAGFKDAHFELGLMLVQADNCGDAVGELEQARPLKSQQAARYFYGMAYCKLHLGDAIAARNLVDQGRAYTKSPEEIAILDRLAETIGRPLVTGVLQEIECRGKLATLRVRIGDSLRAFLIPDITGAIDLHCGPQKDTPVEIEFQSMPLGATGADGIVKSLALR